LHIWVRRQAIHIRYVNSFDRIKKGHACNCPWKFSYSSSRAIILRFLCCREHMLENRAIVDYLFLFWASISPCGCLRCCDVQHNSETPSVSFSLSFVVCCNLPLITEPSIRPHSKLSPLVPMSSFLRLRSCPSSPPFSLALWISGLSRSKIVRMAPLSSR